MFDWKVPVVDWKAPVFDLKALEFDWKASEFDRKALVVCSIVVWYKSRFGATFNQVGQHQKQLALQRRVGDLILFRGERAIREVPV